MASKIEQDIAQIRTAIYGKEVREAIADGIERCYSESTAAGQIEQIEAAGEEARKNFVNAFIPEYDSLTFPIAAGTLCGFDGTLYVSTQDIDEEETWNPGHWAATTISEHVQDKTDVKADKADTVLNTTLSRGRKANTVSGEGSVAFGADVEASGRYSHAQGNGTIANHRSAHTFGEFNVADPNASLGIDRGGYAEIVGNGTSDTARSNARTLDWSGNERLAGDVYVKADADGTGGYKTLNEADMMTNEALVTMLDTVFGTTA